MTKMKTINNLILLAAAAFLVLGACSSRGAVVKSDSEGGHDGLDTAAVVERVQEIYGAVFKVYNEADSLRNLDIDSMMANDVYERRADFEANYCSSEWNKLMKKVNEIDSLYHQNEMGFWDFDYWIMGQDWHNLSVSDVKVKTLTDTEASVELCLHNFDNVTQLCLLMKREDGTWRIDDFVDMEFGTGFKKDMQDYINSHH